MAVEANLNTISAGYNRSTINENFELIATALEDALSRSGTSPNEMGTDLDLNSNDLLNVGVTNTDRLIVGGTEFVTDEVLAIGPAGVSVTIEVGTVTTGAAGTNVVVTNVGDEVNAVFDITIPRGDTGASGAGTGDMVAAQNLNDVVSKPTAFANIKQAATESATGVVELATTTEAETGTDTARAVTPAGVKAAIDVQVPVLLTDVAEYTKLLDGTISSAATLSIDISSYTDYKGFKLVLTNFKAVTDGVMARVRTSSDGSTYDSGASDYGYNIFLENFFTTTVDRYVDQNSYMELLSTIGNAANEYMNYSEILFEDCFNTTSEKIFRAITYGKGTNGVLRKLSLNGYRNSTSAINGVRVYFSSGNISSGSYRLYGIK